MNQSFKELVKYGIVGFIGLGVDWAAFFLFRDVIGINYIASHILSSILAITNNFVLNSYFTFKATDKIWQRGISFFGIAGIGLVIGSVLLPVFVQLINLSITHLDLSPLAPKVVQNLSKLVITVIIAFLQFFLNKYFTFKKKDA
ncbi:MULTISPECIES: GtrA family protein [unclassified Dysgonomonas]|uniref:GtrA family protein n=1 Tax=unclassified Dysgonomonas TaxID=2630389 RepID=UPI00067FE927|nr:MULTISPECIES: GtrA family protein [unclassified Dysgonomonas]MBD8349399.1 GtrA family protein [Dysgonomonas sp. HGC4]MBF0577999.1 GtrA family protein [Dysgonomonas sp. GY617]